MDNGLFYDFQSDCRQMNYDREQERLSHLDCHDCENCHDQYAKWDKDRAKSRVIFCEQFDLLHEPVLGNECDSFLEK